MRHRKRVTPEIRFFRHVQKTRSCWTWTGATDAKGYGRFNVGDERGVLGAHRFSWIMRHGDVPPGKLVMHNCDNRVCVNPSHLTLGTPWLNSRDMVSKGRSAKGERHSQAVITEQMVIDLRRRFGAGEKLRDLAAEMGISYGTANYAVYVNWKHLPPFVRTRKVSARGKR